MKIDRLVELKVAEDISLCRRDCFWANNECWHIANSFLVHTCRQVGNFQVGKQPFKVDRGLLTACHKAVSAHVIQSVGIKLTGHDGVVNRLRTILLDHVSNIVRETTSKAAKDLGDLTFSDQLIAHLLMVGQCKTELFPDIFKCVTERTMTNIVE